VVDLAFGHGDITSWLRELSVTVTAVDWQVAEP
jgi:hypothetical protein